MVLNEGAVPPSPEVGKTYRHYHLVRRLGGGTMGQVFLATDRLHRTWAVKFLSPTSPLDAEAPLRFTREASAAARISSDCVVRIHTLDEVDGLPFIVMEYVEGHDLSDEFSSRDVPIRTAVAFLESIAEGLLAAHTNGVIHRDIKPANIRIRANGRPVIVDFGLGKIVRATSNDPTQALLTSPNIVLGTLPYMSPEQLRGDDLGTATDIFSFGVVAFELITRTRPFRGTTEVMIADAILRQQPPDLLALRPDAPPALAKLITECMSKEASTRPDADALVARLRAIRRTTAPDEEVERNHNNPPLRAPTEKMTTAPPPPPSLSPNQQGGSKAGAAPPPKERDEDGTPPLAALFLGPRAENAQIWAELFDHIFTDYAHWRKNYFPADPVVVGRDRRRSPRHERWLDKMTAELDFVLNELKHHFPFHSPRYIGHMLSEQTLPSILGLFAGVLYNPNNVTDEAAPITVKLELEVGRMVAEMLGFNRDRSWAHLTSGGTVANIEALWVARTVQFAPLFARDFCAARQIQFPVKRSDGVEVSIDQLDARELLNIRPNEAIFIMRRLARFIHQNTRQPIREVLSEINQSFEQSRFNVARRGFAQVAGEMGMKPLILVSAAAHYSIKKAANVLGYGEDAVRLIDVNHRFQVDLPKLRDAIFNVRPNEYIAAVIGVIGTTEEGAVDRVHQIRFMRDELEKNQRRSFWLHLDAAWGGYIRALFCDVAVPKFKRGSPLEDICNAYIEALSIQEEFELDRAGYAGQERKISIRWAEKELYASFLAMGDADSITVDPHKLGYVPYPAGLVAFRNGLVTELIAQKAQYISDIKEGIKGLDEQAPVRAVGPYILEGSKPGAVALGCWLAHKTIPLSAHGHGKIVRTTLLNTKKLFNYLLNHRHMFQQYQLEYCGDDDAHIPFTFIPIFQPETNIICFVAHPMAVRNRELVQVDTPLRELNAINSKVYHAASVGADERRSRMATAQPFYISRTQLTDDQYRLRSIDLALKRAGIMSDDYREQGLFVLRSTVMNPWYFEAEKAGINYLREFVGFLHAVTHRVLSERKRDPSRSKFAGA